MLKWVKYLLALVLCTCALHGVAQAEGITKYTPRIMGDPPPPPSFSWAGVYFDAGVGGSAALFDLNAQAFDGEQQYGSAGLNGLGAWDWTGNARVGINMQQQGSPLVFGVFAGYSLGSMKVEADISSISDSIGASAKLTPTWDVGAIIGWSGPNKSLLYTGYRYQMADFDLSLPGGLCGGVQGLNCSEQLGGHGLILGFKMPVSSALVLGIEYGYTKFDDVTVFNEGGTKVNLEPESHTVMLRGSLHIGPSLFGANY